MELKEEEKTYEFGLIVGTKREREYWQNKIREKIEKIKNKPNNPKYPQNSNNAIFFVI